MYSNIFLGFSQQACRQDKTSWVRRAPFMGKTLHMAILITLESSGWGRELLKEELFSR